LPDYGTSLDGPVALSTADGHASAREYGIDEAKWNVHDWGVEVTREPNHPDGCGKDLFPFTNMLTFTVLPNSKQYEALLLEYIRNCEHVWITHPRIVPPLTYCEECRVDMSDLAVVMDPKTADTPALVVESLDLDRISHAFDGQDPFSRLDSIDGLETSGPTMLVISADDVSENIQRLVDEQLGGEAESGVDDPDNTEF
jgi:hypothetical protein